MPHELAGREGARVLRWMDDSPVVFEHLRRMSHEYNQAEETA